MPAEQPQLSQERFNEINEIFSQSDDDYEIINGDNQEVFGMYRTWTDSYVRHRYMQDADRMVGMLDGTIRTRKVGIEGSGLRDVPPPDIVIALDKSGRPLKDIAEAFWEGSAKEDEESNETVKMPEFDFLNIDRIDWLDRMGVDKRTAEDSSPKTLNMDAISRKQLARIRAYFVEGDLTEEGWEEEVWNLPTRLDGKEILILDEVKNSGATLRIATELIHRAIPESKNITGDYFWTDSTHKTVNNGRDKQYGTVPLWYSHATSWGRGVGDVHPSYYASLYEKDPTQENLRNKIASFVLSAPHHDPETMEKLKDERYLMLCRDIGRLAMDSSGLRLPYVLRDDDDDDTRLDKLSDKTGISPNELIMYRRMLAENG